MAKTTAPTVDLFATAVFTESGHATTQRQLRNFQTRFLDSAQYRRLRQHSWQQRCHIFQKKIGIVELNRDILGGVTGARQAQQLIESVRTLQSLQAAIMASALAVPAAAGAGAAATATPVTDSTMALEAL